MYLAVSRGESQSIVPLVTVWSEEDIIPPPHIALDIAGIFKDLDLLSVFGRTRPKNTACGLTFIPIVIKEQIGCTQPRSVF